ncbi:MAG: 4-hydroxy-tetrahydrodipicolinate synthase [Armatimonadetes bacterium]|nr:4-hydroxy-tetrahydrodipicolinate synthase [Candidatus Hippobium faecium]
MKIEGTWTALITPFTSDDVVDIEGFKKNIEFQIKEGITGVLAVGTSGESPTLSWEEHNKVIETASKTASGKIGVIAGTGSNSTKEAIVNSKQADECGVDGCLLVDCYYNGPSSSELRDEYYAQVADKVSCEVIPYIIPGRSGCQLLPEDLAILSANCKNINAVKDATGNFEEMKRVREVCGKDFSIMSGDDDLNFAIITDPDIKGNGVISVVTNVCPGAMSRMVNLVAEGCEKEAKVLADKLAPLCNIVTVKTKNARIMPNGETVYVTDKYRNPLPYKILMKALGMPSGDARKPLGKMTKSGLDVLRETLKCVIENSPELLLPINDFYGVDVEMRINDDNIWSSL